MNKEEIGEKAKEALAAAEKMPDEYFANGRVAAREAKKAIAERANTKYIRLCYKIPVDFYNTVLYNSSREGEIGNEHE